MSIPIEAWPVPNVVQAPLKHRVKGVGKPAVYAASSGTDVSKGTSSFEWQSVSIADSRPIVDRLSLDEEGFELHPHNTKIKNFYDNDEVRTVYYPEVEQLVKTTTGASRVIIFDHTVRFEDAAQGDESAIRSPVRVVHNDYTVRSGVQRVHDILDEEDAKTFLQHRFAIVNVWRSIAAPVEIAPLAIADAQSISDEDFVATDLIFPDRTGEIYQVVYSSNHRWFYFPKMRRDEVLLLKTYDSATDGRARFTAHSAFDDPTTPNDAPPRESIEVRTLVSFAP